MPKSQMSPSQMLVIGLTDVLSAPRKDLLGSRNPSSQLCNSYTNPSEISSSKTWVYMNYGLILDLIRRAQAMRDSMLQLIYESYLGACVC